MFCRVTFLDVVLAKLMAEELLAPDEVTAFLRHAELLAGSFVDQCRTVLKLMSESDTEDEVRTSFHRGQGELRIQAPMRILV